MAKSKFDISLNDLKAMLPHEGSPAEQEAALRALAALSQEDRNLLAAVQESPYRLTSLEQFREFPANTEYFILESNISKVEDVGWRYLAQHLDVLLSPELLDAIDPAPFGKYAMQEEQGCYGREGAGHLLDVGGVHLDDVPINRHFAEIGAAPLCVELGHLLFYQGPFLCCHRAAQDDGPFAICHSVCLRFLIRVWDYPSKQFLRLGARGSLNRKFASVATLSLPRQISPGMGE